MPRFDFNSMILDGKNFQIVDRSVKLRLATQAEALTYKRQPRQGAVKISNNDLKAIQKALAASINKKLTISLVDTNGTRGNFVNSDNIASFTGRILSTSKAGNDLSIQALTNQLQKSFNKLSSRPIYNADQVNEESINPSPSPTPPTPDPEPSPNPTPTPTPSGEGDGGGSPAPTFIVTATNYGTQGGSKYTFSGTATGLITLTGNQTQYTFTRAALARPQTPNIGAGEAFIELDQNAASVDASQYTGTNAIALRFSFQGTGNGNITGSPLDDVITGGAGGDTLVGGAGADTMTGGSGSDTLTGSAGADDFIIDSGVDVITDFGNGGNDDIVVTAGTTANATLIAANAVSAVSTNAGALNASTSVGTQLAASSVISFALLGGTNGVNLNASSQINAGVRLTGSEQSDTITGGGGDDILVGLGGADIFRIDAGTDQINQLGYGGQDVVVVSAGATLFYAGVNDDWAASNETSNNGVLARLVSLYDGIDINLANATGTCGWEINGFEGTGGNEVLTGSVNADTINGHQGNDTISGGDGSDIITGGMGQDVLTGGNGANTFVFTNGESVDTAPDSITDFKAVSTGADVVDFTSPPIVRSNGSVDVGALVSGSVTANIANGIISLSGTNAGAIDTLAEWASVVRLVVTNQRNVAGFEFGGDTYVYQERSVLPEYDILVQLDTLTGISAVATTAGSNTVLIA